MTQHTTTIIGDQQVARVEFVQDEPCGYLWYPVHAWLHRSGLYPLLPPGARGLIDVMLWRDWEQSKMGGHAPGQVIATIEQLAAWCGDSTRTTFRAVGFLLNPPPVVVAITGNPARLLAKLGPTVWEPMPGRTLIRRKGAADTPLPSMAKPCHNSGAPSKESRARGFDPRPEIDQNNNSQSGAVVVDLLLGAGIGFKPSEAEALASIPEADEQKVRNAIAGAVRTRKAGKLKTSPHRDADACMRAWVASALRNRWNLFDQAAADRHTQERAAANLPRLIEEFQAKAAPGLGREETGYVLRCLGGWEGCLKSVAYGLPSWQRAGAARIREILMHSARVRCPDDQGVCS